MLYVYDNHDKVLDVSIFFFQVETTALEGEVSTPLFKQPFDWNSFKPQLSLNILIYIPESITNTVARLITDHPGA